MKIRHAFGKNIQNIRKERLWTQEQLAEAARLDPRTVQRAESGDTQGPETLQAIAGALDVDLDKLRSTTLVPESKLVKTELLTTYREFIKSEEINDSQVFSKPIMAPLSDDSLSQVEELWEAVFTDRDCVEPDDPDLWPSYIKAIREPLTSLFERDLAVFALNEVRDFLLPSVGDMKPDRSYTTWRVRHLVLVPRFGCFRTSPDAALHQVDSECAERGNVFFGALKNSSNLFVYKDALPIVVTELDDATCWCDQCFPKTAQGMRIDLDYIQKARRISRAELLRVMTEQGESLFGLS
jgi:transcriptional regulator with XRE-family HTH domain